MQGTTLTSADITGRDDSGGAGEAIPSPTDLVDVRGIVLAGVHHWGATEFERLLPRPLMPVADSPLISYALRQLRDAGVAGVTLCANSDSHLLRACLGDGAELGLDLAYYEDLSPRGPAGCVRDAVMRWPARDNVVLEGSVIPWFDLRALLAAHRQSGAVVTVVVEAGVGGAGPAAHPAGVYVFGQQAVRAVPPRSYQDIKEVLIPRLHSEGALVQTYAVPAACPRVNGLESYLAANDWMVRRLVEDEPPWPGYRREGESLVHESAIVADGARLVGPVQIGARTCVARGATIVGPTVIGQGCTIMEAGVVCRAVLWDDCHVARRACVDQCVLATGATVSADVRIRHELRTAAAPQADPAQAVPRTAGRRCPPTRRDTTARPGDENEALEPGGRDES